jgi:mannose-6-phosphate isomerase-like protein (cupin superfamily)
MKEKEVAKKGVSRRNFFKLASAAGFGTVAGPTLFSIPNYDFGGDPDVSGHSLGILYRIREANVTDDKNSFSISELILEPGSETFVMFNKESDATFEGVDGQAIVLSSDPGKPKKSEKVEKRKKKTIKAGKHFQLVNPARERARVMQKFQPIWKPDKAFVKVGRNNVKGSDMWFELRETLERREASLKYRLIKSNKGMALMDVRLEPGVESAVEFHKRNKHSYTVMEGKGILVKDGRRMEMKPRDKFTIEPGTKFQLLNPNSGRWELRLKTQPGWRPEDAFYVVGNRTIPGADVYFGIHLG